MKRVAILFLLVAIPILLITSSTTVGAQSSAVVEGLVLWNEEPVPGAKVVLKNQGSYYSNPILAETTVIGDGSFELSYSVSGDFMIYAVSPTQEFWDWTGKPITIKTGQSVSAGTFYLSKKLTLLKPQNGSTITTTTPTFSWSAFPDATRYHLNVFNNGTGEAVIRTDLGSSTSFTAETPLQPDVTYQWSVNAYNAQSNPIAYYSPYTFTITSPMPLEISLYPTSFGFNGAVGAEDPPHQTLYISNPGGSSLDWFISGGAEWLNLSSFEGSIPPGGTDQVSLSISTAGFEPGNYTATVTVMAPEASNSPQSVPVTLNLEPGAVLATDRSRIDFQATAGAGDPPRQTLTIRNAGGASLNWSISGGAGWLDLSRLQGRIPAGGTARVTLSVRTAGLAPGDYTVTMTVMAHDASNPPQTLLVTLNLVRGPALALDQSRIDFLATARVGDPPNQTLTIRNPGGTSVEWSISGGSDWLDLSRIRGSISAGRTDQVIVGVRTTGLEPGDYTATITVRAPQASNSPQSILVTLKLVSGPALSLDQSRLDFQTVAGAGAPTSQTLTIRNPGGAPLDWSISGGADWLDLSRFQGIIHAGGTEQVSLSVSTAGLEPGDYTTTITVRAPQANNSPQTVPVTLTLVPGPALALDLSRLDFHAAAGAGDPPSQTLTIRNPGGAPLDWSISGGADWLGLSRFQGSIPAGGTDQVSIRVSTAGLAPGEYTATITLIAPEASDPPQSLLVTFNLVRGAALALDASRIHFDAAAGVGDPPRQTLTIRNPGGSTLDWSASGGAEWLGLSHFRGRIPAGGTEQVSLGVRSAGLPPGNYTTTITVMAPDASNSPQAIPVTLNLMPGAALALDHSRLNFHTAGGAVDPPSQTLTIRNPGGTSLDWSISGGADWLGLSRFQGSIPAGGTEQVSLSVRTAGLAPGSHTATMLVMAPAASNSPQNLNIALLHQGVNLPGGKAPAPQPPIVDYPEEIPPRLFGFLLLPLELHELVWELGAASVAIGLTGLVFTARTTIYEGGRWAIKFVVSLKTRKKETRQGSKLSLQPSISVASTILGTLWGLLLSGGSLILWQETIWSVPSIELMLELVVPLTVFSILLHQLRLVRGRPAPDLE